MKTRFAPVLFAAALLLAGCGQGSNNPPAAASGNPVTAPVDYVASSVKAQQNMVKTIDTTALDQAVQLFNVQEGRLPKKLDELVQKKYLGKLPDAPAGMKLSYDAVAGKVTVVKQ